MNSVTVQPSEVDRIEKEFTTETLSHGGKVEKSEVENLSQAILRRLSTVSNSPVAETLEEFRDGETRHVCFNNKRCEQLLQALSGESPHW